MNLTEAMLKSSSATPSPERRSFLWKMGAALSAAFASTVAGATELMGTSKASETDGLSRRLLEDTNAIHQLHRAYRHYLNNNMHEAIVDLFAENGEVYFNGGIFMGKDQGIRRLYLGRFGRGFKGQNNGPVHRFLLDHGQQQDAIEVAPDRKSATARFQCLVQAWVHDTSEYPMMDLARQQGQGILQWWEAGLYENSYVKEGEVWKIKILDYRPQGPADHIPGWSGARPAYVVPFSKTCPDDPMGPDRISDMACSS